MTTINELEERIKDAEAALDAMKTDLDHLKQQEQTEPESLFGRWATHPKHGRGIIISGHEDRESEVEFAYVEEDSSTGAIVEYVRTSSLTRDPATLTTVEYYRAAPVGTIIEINKNAVARKISESFWERTDTKQPWLNEETAEMGPARVIRWGAGE